MKIAAYLMLLVASISLSACSMTGNVIPQSGPSMEQIYDEAGASEQRHAPHTEKLSDARKNAQAQLAVTRNSNGTSQRPHNFANNEFKKLPNPGLTMYVYPHFAGNDQVPIPGYYTEFDGYQQNHYVVADNH